MRAPTGTAGSRSVSSKAGRGFWRCRSSSTWRGKSSHRQAHLPSITDSTYSQARAASSAAYVELLAGDARAAELHARAACDLLESAGELGYLASATPSLIGSLIEQGRDEEALGLTERWRPERLTVPEDVDAQVGWRLVRAKLLARRGDGAEAETLARDALVLVAPTDYLDLRALALADLGAVLRIAGRRDEADAGIREAVALYEQKGNIAAAARLRNLASDRTLEV